MSAIRRVSKEFAEIQKENIPYVFVNPDESNMLHWTGYIEGPPDSAFAGGYFPLDIVFPTEYPFKSPNVKFTTRVYHPNVSDDGAFCLGLTKPESWKPSIKMEQILRSLVQLLEEPNPDDALVASIAEVYNADRAKFKSNAQEWVKKYASARP